MPALNEKRLSKAVATITKLAETDPEIAAAVRDRIRPHLEYRSEQLHHEAALAKIAASGPDCEVALEEMGRTAATLPGYVDGLRGKLERAVGMRGPRRKALWLELRRDD